MTVPGVVDGWSELLSKLRHHPDVESGRAGDRATRRTATRCRRSSAGQWKAARAEAGGRSGDAPRPSCRAATRRSRARSSPTRISRRRCRQIAAGGRDAFYKGPIARAILADMRKRDGLLEERDFTEHTRRLDPADLDELPRLRRLRDAAEHAGVRRPRDAEHPRGVRPQVDGPQLARSTCTLLVEAKRIAFADRAAYLGDPGRRCPPTVLQDADLEGVRGDCAARRSIRRARRRRTRPGAIKGVSSSAGAEADQNFTGRDLGDTIYMTVADGKGNVVSLIQSLFSDFGSGIVAGDTGIVLHNRGSGVQPDRRTSRIRLRRTSGRCTRSSRRS